MRKTQREQVLRKDIRAELAAALIERIDEGTAPWQWAWDPTQGDDRPINAVTGKHYRGINQFWLTLNQPSSDPRWCTFKQAQEKDWQIRKGSHGTAVEKWLVVEKSKEIDIDGSTTTVEGKHLVVKFYTVFHASQIEGMPELERRELANGSLESDTRVTKVVSDLGVNLNHGGNRAFYAPSSDTIQLPEPDAFSSPADYDTVLLHEIGHATGHQSRLNRNISNSFGTAEYAKEELRAEISAAMNARVLGIAFDPTQVDKSERSGIENSASYLRSWLQALPEEDQKPELMSAITAAQRISDYVLAFALALPEKEEADLESSMTSFSRMRL